MNLVEQLLKADAKKAEDFKTGVFKSERLAMILGAGEPVEVKIREIHPRRLNDILAYQMKGNGDVNYSKTFDAKIMVCLEGITDPDPRDKALQGHFGTSDAKSLVERLFRSEVTEISDAISELSGIKTDKEVEDEVKN